MIKDKVDSLKKALVKVNKKDDNSNNKKSIENLVTLAIILVVTLIAVNYILKGDKKNNKNYREGSNDTSSNYSISEEYNAGQDTNITNNDNENLEQRLSEILSKINGVGEVKVLLTYAQTKEINPVYNEDEQLSTTEETDTSGGKRIISSSNNKKEVVYSNNNIVVQSVSNPQIQGAVIIAKGAGDIAVKTDIIQAVSAATGLSTSKIQVFEMN